MEERACAGQALADRAVTLPGSGPCAASSQRAGPWGQRGPGRGALCKKAASERGRVFFTSQNK